MKRDETPASTSHGPPNHPAAGEVAEANLSPGACLRAVNRAAIIPVPTGLCEQQTSETAPEWVRMP